jgi:hypothetical protein
MTGVWRLRFRTRWLDQAHLQVDNVDEMQRETYCRADDGFQLVRTEPLEEPNAQATPAD